MSIRSFVDVFEHFVFEYSSPAVAVAGPHAEIAQTAARARAQHRSSGGSARHVALPGGEQTSSGPRVLEYYFREVTGPSQKSA